jgi:uncharacterized membrane protein YdjX (TVP38/TMEM64 family)
VLILQFSPLHEYINDIQAMQQYLDNMGLWAPLVFVLGSAGLIAIGSPRLILCTLSGLFFGFIEGLILAHIASILGSYGTFLFARWGGGEWLSAKIVTKPKVAKLLANPSATTVFIIRQLPIYGLITNILLGMAVISHSAFLVGSFFGFLPTGIGASLIGSGLGKDSPYASLIQIASAAVLFIIAMIGVMKVRKKFYADE